MNEQRIMELKSQAYDLIATREIALNQINAINQEIRRLTQTPPEVTAAPSDDELSKEDTNTEKE